MTREVLLSGQVGGEPVDEDDEDGEPEDEIRVLNFEQVKAGFVGAAKRSGLRVVGADVELNMGSLDRRLSVRVVPTECEDDLGVPYVTVEIIYSPAHEMLVEGASRFVREEGLESTQAAVGYHLLDPLEEILARDVGAHLDPILARLRGVLGDDFWWEYRVRASKGAPHVDDAQATELFDVRLTADHLEDDLDFFERIAKALRALTPSPGR
jgi:hypothetical protein